MSLTPEEIEHQVFKERFRGYDQDEVDRFLDTVSERIGQLLRERDELADRLRETERRSSEAKESETLLQRALVTAQRAADETIDEARATAEQTIDDARRQAEQILAEADRQVGERERRAHDVLAHVRHAVDELARFRTEYRQRIEGVIAEQLAMLDRAEDIPELPAGLQALAQADLPARGDEEADQAGHVYWDHGREA